MLHNSIIEGIIIIISRFGSEWESESSLNDSLMSQTALNSLNMITGNSLLKRKIVGKLILLEFLPQLIHI